MQSTRTPSRAITFMASMVALLTTLFLSFVSWGRSHLPTRRTLRAQSPGRPPGHQAEQDLSSNPFPDHAFISAAAVCSIHCFARFRPP